MDKSVWTIESAWLIDADARHVGKRLRELGHHVRLDALHGQISGPSKEVIADRLPSDSLVVRFATAGGTDNDRHIEVLPYQLATKPDFKVDVALPAAALAGELDRELEVAQNDTMAAGAAPKADV